MDQEAYLLKRHGALPVRPPIGFFSVEEERLLHRYGAWYRALHEGKLEARTEEKRRFVQCALGNLPPVSAHEIVYRKYLDLEARKLRKDNGGVGDRSGKGKAHARSSGPLSAGIDFPVPANPTSPQKARQEPRIPEKRLPEAAPAESGKVAKDLDHRSHSDEERAAALRYMREQRDSMSD